MTTVLILGVGLALVMVALGACVQLMMWGSGSRPEPLALAPLSPAADPLETPVRSLEGRIVVCANCDAKTTLYTSSSGSLLCGVCGSPSWLFEIPRPTRRLVNPVAEVRQLQHWYQLRPNDLPIELREIWMNDAKLRAEARVRKAGGGA